MTIREEFVKGKIIALPNLEVEWCHVQKPDTQFGKSQWEMTCRLPETLALEMKEVGFNVKKKSQGKNFKAGSEDYWFIVAYRKTQTAKGEPLTPPKIFKRDGQTIEEALIGNGSICNVKISAKYVEVSGEMKLPCRLISAQVVKLVPFGDAGFDAIPDDDAAGDSAAQQNSF